MKKYQLVPLMFALSALLFSCKKDDSSIPVMDEAAYKDKLISMINLQPSTTTVESLNSDKETTHLKFNTYKEAYEYFQTLLNQKSTATIQTQLIDSSSISSSKTAATVTSGSITYTYTGFAVNTGGLPNSSFGSIAVTYSATAAITYVYKEINGVRTYTESYPEGTSSVQNLDVVYSGLGTIEPGTKNITPSSLGGNVNGTMHGEITISGVTGSFYIIWQGTYMFSKPSAPANPTLTSTLVVTSK